ANPSLSPNLIVSLSDGTITLMSSKGEQRFSQIDADGVAHVTDRSAAFVHLLKQLTLISVRGRTVELEGMYSYLLPDNGIDVGNVKLLRTNLSS
ncbi:MAG: hypothetical protein Q8R82_21645, partial [Hyphomonadaceae bacterium]|nr:hypothetical protein [Hyphomonadaceae bacterium]